MALSSSPISQFHHTHNFYIINTYQISKHKVIRSGSFCIPFYSYVRVWEHPLVDHGWTSRLWGLKHRPSRCVVCLLSFAHEAGLMASSNFSITSASSSAFKRRGTVLWIKCCVTLQSAFKRLGTALRIKFHHHPSIMTEHTSSMRNLFQDCFRIKQSLLIPTACSTVFFFLLVFRVRSGERGSLGGCQDCQGLRRRRTEARCDKLADRSCPSCFWVTGSVQCHFYFCRVGFLVQDFSNIFFAKPMKQEW